MGAMKAFALVDEERFYYFEDQSSAQTFSQHPGCGRAVSASTVLIGKAVYTHKTPVWRVKWRGSLGASLDATKRALELGSVLDPMRHLR